MIVQNIIKICLVTFGIALVYIAFFTQVVDESIKGVVETKWFKLTNFGTKLLMLIVALLIFYFVDSFLPHI